MNPRKPQTPPGIHDLLPKDHEFHTFIKKVVRHRARQAGFLRITTPVLEFAEIVENSLGAESALAKKLYTFEDPQGMRLALKPEGLTGIMRAYLQHNMDTWTKPVELYFIEPHFRYETPQKGLYRQFWQFGFEVIGEHDPALDAQCISLAYKIFKDLGVEKRLQLRLNNIGGPKTREKIKDVLLNYYIGKERSLCEHCNTLLQTSPLELLACQEEDCQILAQLAPKMKDYRTKEDQDFYRATKSFLDELGIEYTEDESLVRGPDYYTQTVFEFWPKNGGRGEALCRGGRTDGLIEKMGGASTPALGFTCGMDRLVMHMKEAGMTVPSKDKVHVFVAQLGEDAKRKALPLIDALRERGVHTVGALGKGSMKDQLALATTFGVPYMLLLGITEVREGTVIIRDMSKGQQRHVKMEDAVDEVVKLIGEAQLDTYSPGEVSLGRS